MKRNTKTARFSNLQVVCPALGHSAWTCVRLDYDSTTRKTLLAKPLMRFAYVTQAHAIGVLSYVCDFDPDTIGMSDTDRFDVL